MKNIHAILIFILFSTVVNADLTVVSFGGAYGAAQQKHMIDPYVKKTGNKVLFENYSGGVAELKAQVESGQVNWDVLDIEYIDLERACSEGMLESLKLEDLPAGIDDVAAKQDFVANALHECAVGNIIWSIVVGYRDDINVKPQSIADFFDLEKIHGKRAMRKRPQVNLEWALLADGVASEEVYQLLSTEKGVQRAFAKLDSIKNNVIWFDSWSQVPQMLNDGSVVMGQSANGRLFDAITKGAKFEILWDGQVYDLDGWAIPKGSKNQKQAWEFIKFSTQSLPLAGMQDVAYGSTRHSSAPYIAELIKPNLPSAHLSVGLKASGEFWADNGEDLGERFLAWLIKK
ncbi:ABC transporter, periplasmic spermidine putrescine-binding protein PotD (TC 3.A.1.11.1) [uncultured Candidatus Thioglobus sp.]|nr:ABC transporter, periplasmic spermidine putrescine-binding protein PotD (TC 3.A.1.11.1) [uncultured Candidatus Thioglobus sp.]